MTVQVIARNVQLPPIPPDTAPNMLAMVQAMPPHLARAHVYNKTQPDRICPGCRTRYSCGGVWVGVGGRGGAGCPTQTCTVKFNMCWCVLYGCGCMDLGVRGDYWGQVEQGAHAAV